MRKTGQQRKKENMDAKTSGVSLPEVPVVYPSFDDLVQALHDDDVEGICHLIFTLQRREFFGLPR